MGRPLNSYEIVNARRLARAVAAIVAAVGSTSAAAQRAKLSRAMLNQLKRQRRRTLDARTYDKLQRAAAAVPSAERKAVRVDLHESVATRANPARLSDYEQWCDEIVSRLLTRRAARWDRFAGDAVTRLHARDDSHEWHLSFPGVPGLPSVTTETASNLAHHRRDDLRFLLLHLKHEVPYAWHKLHRLIDGVPPPRAVVAIVRALEPLLQSPESGGVERDWRELTKRELQTFVSRATDNERVLLRRPSDEVQAARF